MSGGEVFHQPEIVHVPPRRAISLPTGSARSLQEVGTVGQATFLVVPHVTKYKPHGSAMHGVSLRDIEYTPTSAGSSLSLAHSQTAYVSKPAPFDNIYLFGLLTYEREDGVQRMSHLSYLGEGDYFRVRVKDSVVVALFLGFARRKGHHYKFLCALELSWEVDVVEISNFVGEPPEPNPPCEDKA
jgi:hypothetical protein